MKYHQLSIDKTADVLKSSPQGLDEKEATRRLSEHGRNEIESRKKKTIWNIILAQLTDFMILVLIAASIVSGVVGDLTDTIVILSIVLLNTVVGVIQEWKAEKAIEALQTMAASKARVLRSDNSMEIPAAELVPGDLVLLEAGNIIPADVRLVESHTLKVDESSLTGESINIEKNTDALSQGDYALGDRVNMGYKGTFVTHGRGKGYVVATGMKTELGRIAEMIQVGDMKTPLQKKLAQFGKHLTIII